MEVNNKYFYTAGLEVDKNYFYVVDFQNKKILNDCHLNPSKLDLNDTSWLFAANFNMYDTVNEEKFGKWMLFLPTESIDAVWNKVKMEIRNGNLWRSNVSTTNPEYSNYAIMIYTKDYTDLEDVINILNILESSGIKSPNDIIKYKTDAQTNAGIYSGGPQKPWIYRSDTIRTGRYARSIQRSSFGSWRNEQTRNQTSSTARNNFSWRNTPARNQASSAPTGHLSWRNRPDTNQASSNSSDEPSPNDNN